MRAVVNSKDLARRVKAVQSRPQERRPSLFAFLLFDERRSHEVVLEFARRQSSWLNRLAGENQMILFLFLPEAEPAAYDETEESIIVADGAQTVANPSLDVARRFGLGPADLPGIIFFGAVDDVTTPGPHEGVYWPLSPELFEGDARAAEDALSEIFGFVQAARAQHPDGTSLVPVLRDDFERRRARTEPRPPELGDRLLQRVIWDRPLADATRFAFAQGLGQ